MAIVFSWSFASVFLTIFQCTPIKASWNKGVKNYTCLDSNALWYQYAVLDIATDIPILLLPVWNLVHLQMSQRKKILLLGLFSLGSVYVEQR